MAVKNVMREKSRRSFPMNLVKIFAFMNRLPMRKSRACINMNELRKAYKAMESIPMRIL